MATVTLPAALLGLFPGAQSKVEAEAATVGELVEALERQWPGMRDRICDSRPQIRRNINVFVGGRRATLETPLPAEAEVSIMTAVTG